MLRYHKLNVCRQSLWQQHINDGGTADNLTGFLRGEGVEIGRSHDIEKVTVDLDRLVYRVRRREEALREGESESESESGEEWFGPFLFSFPLFYGFRHILAARPLGDSIGGVGPRLRYGQHMIYPGNRPRVALGLMVFWWTFRVLLLSLYARFTDVARLMPYGRRK